MIARFKIIALSLTNGMLMLFLLCLGAQNLGDRHKINLIIYSTPPFPTGFIVGTSLTLGLISAGFTSALLINTKRF
tara:strand:- start:89 stop:316 length:228 start_codon:yes stop_codon:yes gene_type:complete